MMIDLVPFEISLKLAFITTLILFIVSIPLGSLLAYRSFAGKFIVETVMTLPMVLPPTVIGFYLLVLFSKNSIPGKLISEYLGIDILFSFKGLVVASAIHSLPYMIHPIRNGFSSVHRSLIEASYVIGKSRITTLFRVILPNMHGSLATGILMTFVHVMGEFGVVLMIGGSIPGNTRTASISLYEKVDGMKYSEAHLYAGMLIAISISVILAIRFLNRRKVSHDQY